MKLKLTQAALIALTMASGSAFAADLSGLSGTVTAKAASDTYTFEAADEGEFIVTDFKFTLSSNVGLAFAQSETAVAVGTANDRGRNGFTGSSEGGSVSPCGPATTGTDKPDVPTPDVAEPNGCSVAP